MGPPARVSKRSRRRVARPPSSPGDGLGQVGRVAVEGIKLDLGDLREAFEQFLGREDLLRDINARLAAHGIAKAHRAGAIDEEGDALPAGRRAFGAKDGIDEEEDQQGGGDGSKGKRGARDPSAVVTDAEESPIIRDDKRSGARQDRDHRQQRHPVPGYPASIRHDHESSCTVL